MGIKTWGGNESAAGEKKNGNAKDTIDFPLKYTTCVLYLLRK